MGNSAQRHGGCVMKDLIAQRSIPEPNTGCWLWTGALSPQGYGKLQIGGRHRMATHISLEAVGRPVPKGMHACHHCDVPACVNPDHLFIGTPLDNIRDCIMKGRNSPPPRTKKGTRSNALVCYGGHPRTADNLYIRDDGYKGCRICRRANELRKLAKQKKQRASEIALRPPGTYACGPDHKKGRNLYISPKGKHECRACGVLAAQRYKAKLRGRIAA